MPILRGAASDVTRLRGLQSSVVADPVRKSASYIPAQPQLLFDIRSSLSGRGVFPSQSVLQSPIVKGFDNPRHRGFIVGADPVAAPPAPLTRITVDLGETDFVLNSGTEFGYNFGLETNPPASDFEVVVINGVNVPNIRYIALYDDDSRDMLGDVTISVTPTFGTFASNINQPHESTPTSGLFGYSSVVTFRNVPLIPNLTIVFAEA